MSRSRNMGNCKSKRQESADLQQHLCPDHNTSNKPDEKLHQNGKTEQGNCSSCSNHNTSSSPGTISETITAQTNKTNLTSGNSPNKHKDKKKNTHNKPHGQQSDAKAGTSSTSINVSKQNKSLNDTVIDSTRAEVSNLIEGINNFQGTTQDDKNYRYFDEMLTRCMLNLDQIECNDNRDRSNRKEAIRGVNEAISILERKLEINSEIKELETSLRNS